MSTRVHLNAFYCSTLQISSKVRLGRNEIERQIEENVTDVGLKFLVRENE
jgi:hypothetical protein